MKRYRYLFLILVLQVCACNIFNSDNASEENDTSLLSMVFVGNKLLYEFIYDENNRCIAVNEYHDGTYIRNESYQYNSKGQLEKRFYNEFIGTYEYDAEGLLIKLTKYFEPTDKTWEEIYIYDTENRIQEGLTYYNGEKRGFIDYENDSANNTIERREYEDADSLLINEYRFEFDSNENPYPLRFPLDMTQKNNIIRYYYYNIALSSLPPIYEATFEYNREGLPIREERTSSLGVITVYEFNYTTQ